MERQSTEPLGGTGRPGRTTSRIACSRSITLQGGESCGPISDLPAEPDGSVEDVKFKGQGCAISQASASLMTQKLKGKSRTDAEEMLRAFHDVVTEEVADPPKMLGDLRLMAGVRKFPQRVKCAMLAWRAFEQALEGREGREITTEAV